MFPSKKALNITLKQISWFRFGQIDYLVIFCIVFYCVGVFIDDSELVQAQDINLKLNWNLKKIKIQTLLTFFILPILTSFLVFISS